MTYDYWCWTWSLGWGFMRFHYCKNVFSFPFSTPYPFQGSHQIQLTCKEEEFHFFSLRTELFINYLEFFCMRDLFSSIYYFMLQSFICIGMDRWILILEFGFIIQFCFIYLVHIVLDLAIESSLNSCCYVFLKCTHQCEIVALLLFWHCKILQTHLTYFLPLFYHQPFLWGSLVPPI